MRNRVYKEDLHRAVLAGSEERLELLKEAVILYPEREEPYLQLMETVAGDGDFSVQEQSFVTKILYQRNMGRIRDNISYLQEDEDAFRQFSYRLGMAYFFLAGETGDHYAASGWLSHVADPEGISSCRYPSRAARLRTEAQLLLDLCDYYGAGLLIAQEQKRMEPDYSKIVCHSQKLNTSKP